MRHWVVVISLMLFNMPAYAQIYKWIDEHGKTQYADRPPLSGKVDSVQRLKVNFAPTPVSLSETREKEGTDKSTDLTDERLEYDKRRQERLAEGAEKKVKVAENKQKCIDAQSRLRLFLESPRLRVPDGEGGLIYVDDNVREQKINAASQVVATYCKK